MAPMDEHEHEHERDAVGQREPEGAKQAHSLNLLYAGVITAAALGLFFGLNYEPYADAVPLPPRLRADDPDASVLPATAYADLPGARIGPNAGLVTSVSVPTAAIVDWMRMDPPSEADKVEALAARHARRAYDGAPPTIPHRIDPLDVRACTTCHGPNGLQVGDVTAPAMPHENFASCTQCHAPQHALQADELPLAQNSFEGLAAPMAGERAGPGAPPTIPHATGMRSNCAACHGPFGAQGLRSTHPWRTSCTQCHAPSAELDQHPGAALTGPDFLPGPRTGTR